MATEPETPVADTPRWLHAWAVLTVCATLPLLLLGAEITTKQVGMVDPVGFREPWHMLKVPLRELGLGFVIEHSHRLAGFIVGTCVIVLAVSLWLQEPRRWVRYLGLLALLCVCVQGLLGGFRVNLNALMGRNLALVHGCFAQLVFALLVSLALVTSRTWQRSSGIGESPTLRRWSIVAAAVAYLQLVLGAIVRHQDVVWGARAHLLVAFVLLAVSIWLLKLVVENHAGERARLVPVWVLLGLLTAQLVLGVESWMSRFSSAEWRQTQPILEQPDVVRTLHFVTGSLIFAVLVVMAIQAHRRVSGVRQPAAGPVGQWKGAA
jgi:heme A synthase